MSDPVETILSDDAASHGESLQEENRKLREIVAQREATIRSLARELRHWQMRSPLFYLAHPRVAWREFGKGLHYHFVQRPQRFLFLRYADLAKGGRRLGELRQHEPKKMIAENFPRRSGVGMPLKISIVTPSYNQAQFIGRTIDSVIGQDYRSLEYIVMDGASTDHTVDVLTEKAAHCPQMTWLSESDDGQSDAVVKGFERTTGDVMAWLNSDDMLMPGALPYVADYFRDHPDVDVVYGHRVIVDEEDREIGRWFLPPYTPESITFFDFIPQETLFWRRSAWDKVGGLDRSFQFALDWDLLVRFRNAGCRIVRLPYFTGIFRVHTSQKTSSIIQTVGEAEMNRVKAITGGDSHPRQVVHRAVLREMLRSRMSALALQVGIRKESI